MAKNSDDAYFLGRQPRFRPQQQEAPNQDEAKSKAECLAVVWGMTADDPPVYREAAILWVLGGSEEWVLRHAIDSTGERHKKATGCDRDPWNGTLGAVLELESRGLKSLAATVRKWIAGETPSPAVQTEIDHIVSINGRPGLDFP
jgi:hypothetical protein